MARPKKSQERPISERPDWARRITEARKAIGWNQELLAKRVGQSQTTISDWERGRSEPNLASFGVLAGKLGVSVSWLLLGAGPREPQQGDSAAVTVAERNKDDRNFGRALIGVARMLSEEGVDADALFLVKFAARIAKAAHGVGDQLEARERIDRAIETERQQWRQGLEALKNRI